MRDVSSIQPVPAGTGVQRMREIKGVPAAPKREPMSHKGRYGHALVLAGSPRMTGAALLTATACARAGAGLVTLGMPAAIHHLLAPAILEVMSLPLPSTPDGGFSRDAIQPAIDFATGVTAVALGPGIATENDTAAFAARLVQRLRPPLVLDADGLNCLTKNPAALRAATAPRILTPHPGEAARLAGTTVAEIQDDRTAAAHDLAERFGATVVLKGHRTVVTDGDRFRVNLTGNPGLATGGSGDILTGIIAGLLAQGMDIFDAASLGVHLHGLAGDLAAKRLGFHSLIAGDLLTELGPAFLAHARP